MNARGTFTVGVAALIPLTGLLYASAVLSTKMFLLAQQAQPILPSGIVDDPVLRAWLVIGGLAGGVIALGIFPPQNYRDAVFRWAIAAGFALIVTPMLINHTKLFPPTPDSVFSVGGVTAGFAWTVIELIRSYKPSDIGRIITGIIFRLLGGKNPTGGGSGDSTKPGSGPDKSS